MSDQVEPVVVGVDYGTLSGRAVVVRVADGAELGAAVHPYAHGVMDRALAASGAGCRRTGRCRCRRTTCDVLRDAVPEALAASGVDPAQVIGIGTDFTACTVLPALRRRHPAVRAAGVRGPAARVREAVEAPRGAAAGRPDQRARRGARRALAGPVRRAGSPPSGSSPRRCRCWRRTRRSTPGRDRWIEAADWIVWQLTRRLAAQRLHGRLQGRSTRTARYPSRDYLAALQPGLRGLRRRQGRRTRSAQLGARGRHA